MLLLLAIIASAFSVMKSDLGCDAYDYYYQAGATCTDATDLFQVVWKPAQNPVCSSGLTTCVVSDQHSYSRGVYMGQLVEVWWSNDVACTGDSTNMTTFAPAACPGTVGAAQVVMKYMPYATAMTGNWPMSSVHLTNCGTAAIQYMWNKPDFCYKTSAATSANLVCGMMGTKGNSSNYFGTTCAGGIADSTAYVGKSCMAGTGPFTGMWVLPMSCPVDYPAGADACSVALTYYPVTDNVCDVTGSSLYVVEATSFSVLLGMLKMPFACDTCTPAMGIPDVDPIASSMKVALYKDTDNKMYNITALWIGDSMMYNNTACNGRPTMWMRTELPNCANPMIPSPIEKIVWTHPFNPATDFPSATSTWAQAQLFTAPDVICSTGVGFARVKPDYCAGISMQGGMRKVNCNCDGTATATNYTVGTCTGTALTTETFSSSTCKFSEILDGFNVKSVNCPKPASCPTPVVTTTTTSGATMLVVSMFAFLALLF